MLTPWINAERMQRWTNAAELKALISGNAGYISFREDNVKFYDGGFGQ